ncbi:OmpW/AlkL family protein [Winogradskyella sp. UBA3174]|uniref:OmpW/AlkL family protein n=1 Tax=Winogradskyella sp. UBA3174 TaxID=1947785 RepID=UPI0025D25B33|nr:OmpW family outer membrane protein [Winogradskyella sp. UBA3174]|tara:strand:+ start:11829 stop:12452 length:624 start_codon:yes stop_codon:yes gene_type:complete
MLLAGFTFNLNAQEDMATDDYSKWQIRFRLISVIPNESADIEAIGGDVEIDAAFVPELDFTYFFTKNWAVELILATANHDVNAVDTAVGDIDLGDVWLLPPTLTLQYHFYTGNFKPYLGAGINYTIFYGIDEGDVADNVEYENSIGFAFQGGLDYNLNDKWFLNLDVKYILLSTDATVDATSALGATVGVDVDINPLIIGFGVGMKF